MSGERYDKGVETRRVLQVSWMSGALSGSTVKGKQAVRPLLDPQVSGATVPAPLLC